MSARTSEPAKFDAIIVGAGVGGLYAIHRLRKLGLKVRAFEAGGGVGGTWFWNRYPGCRCDVESMEYSYSFSDELQQEWHWPERYGTQPEILRYINHVADRFDLQARHRVQHADQGGGLRQQDQHVDGQDRQGRDRRPRASASWRRAISRRRARRTIPGLESFKGKWYHTGLWPHEGVDFTGLRVGRDRHRLVGRPDRSRIIARQAKHLYVFQRTANFSLPARNAPLDPDEGARAQGRISRAPPRRLRYAVRHRRLSAAGEVRARGDRGGAAARLRGEMGRGRQHQLPLFAYTDLLVNKESNDTASEFVRQKIRATVKDPKTAELLCPNDHPIGTKRLILDTDYYETYNRDNVTLVDIRSKPIKEITPDGLRTADAEYALDAIVFATGFDAMTGAMKEIDIRTDAGLSIRGEVGGRPAHLSRAS